MSHLLCDNLGTSVSMAISIWFSLFCVSLLFSRWRPQRHCNLGIQRRPPSSINRGIRKCPSLGGVLMKWCQCWHSARWLVFFFFLNLLLQTAKTRASNWVFNAWFLTSECEDLSFTLKLKSFSAEIFTLGDFLCLACSNYGVIYLSPLSTLLLELF